MARQSGRLLVSGATLEELDDVLRRPKIAEYISEDQRLGFLAAYLREAEHVTVTTRFKACRDPKDDKFLELAVDGKATHIVTRDHDLLTLGPFRGIAIRSPADFLNELER